MVRLTVNNGTNSVDAASIVHERASEVQITGESIKAGDWVVWVRSDKHTNCSNALSSLTSPLPVDGEHDHGGLVYDSGGGRLRVNVQLAGEIDGMTDPDPHDSNQTLGDGQQEEPTSTYTMCHAPAQHNGETYNATHGPRKASEFRHYPYVKLYTQPLPPAFPPPYPPAPIDSTRPKIKNASLDANASDILLIYFSELVVPIEPSGSDADQESNALTGIHGSHFRVVLGDGSASLARWSRVEFPRSISAVPSAGRQLSEMNGLTQVALRLELEGTVDAAGQTVDVAAQLNALADTSGNPMGTELVNAGSIMPGMGLLALTAVPVVLLAIWPYIAGATIAISAAGFWFALVRRRRRRQKDPEDHDHESEGDPLQQLQQMLEAEDDGQVRRHRRHTNGNLGATEMTAIEMLNSELNPLASDYRPSLRLHVQHVQAALRLKADTPHRDCHCKTCEQVNPIARKAFAEQFGRVA